MQKNTYRLLTEKFGISEKVLELIGRAEEKAAGKFAELDDIRAYNQYKVLDIFRKNKISDRHFAWNTGYGYDDAGREALESVYAGVFGAESAIVRPLIVNGTHALTLTLTGILRPGDEIVYCTGAPYDTLEEYWAYWSRYIYINRYQDAPKPVYQKLLSLMKNKSYFVITTNVDHCFQKAGFDKNRLFYTQGDYGLFQCSEPCCKEKYDNEEIIRKMLLAQGYQIPEDGSLVPPENGNLSMRIPSELVPYCPHCGKPMSMNLRADDTFVEDKGWHACQQKPLQIL